MEVLRGATTAGSAHADVGQFAQLVASLEATVRERGEARTEARQGKVKFLSLIHISEPTRLALI
eukprot:7939883-Alexandrium_andersonii.AAC.1